jgi:Ribosomal protein S27
VYCALILAYVKLRVIATPNAVVIIFLFYLYLQTVGVCSGCAQVLTQPTGGKARLTEGCSFRKKVD